MSFKVDPTWNRAGSLAGFLALERNGQSSFYMCVSLFALRRISLTTQYNMEGGGEESILKGACLVGEKFRAQEKAQEKANYQFLLEEKKTLFNNM